MASSSSSSTSMEIDPNSMVTSSSSSSSSIATATTTTSNDHRCLVWFMNGEMEFTLEGPQGTVKKMKRPVAEALEKPLQRLRLTYNPPPKPVRNKKQKPNNASSGPESSTPTTETPAQPISPPVPPVSPLGDAQTTTLAIPVELVDGKGVMVPETLANGEAWADGHVLRIGPNHFHVCVNLPRVRLEFNQPMMVGCPVIPQVVNTNLVTPVSPATRPTPGSTAFRTPIRLSEVDHYISTARWVWYRLPASITETIHPDKATVADLEAQGHIVGRSRSYVPTPEDEGARLGVVCIPVRKTKYGSEKEGSENGETELPGLASVAVSKTVHLSYAAQAPLPPAALAPRHAFTSASPACPPAFRVVSYNLLADAYTGTAFAEQVLFSYCPKEHLSGNYRKQLIANELISFNAHVLCMQEVGKTAFRDYFGAHLVAHGYDGIFVEKTGNVPEGCAIAWKTDAFRLLSHHYIPVGESYLAHQQTLHAEIRATIESADNGPQVLEALLKSTVVGQLAIFECVASGRKLAVLNTHLFFHPNAPHLRLLQTHILLTEAHAILHPSSTSPDNNNRKCPMTPPSPMAAGSSANEDPAYGFVFTGDFNSVPLNGVFEYQTNGFLSREHEDWKRGAPFRWGKGDDFYDYLDNKPTTPPPASVPTPDDGPQHQQSSSLAPPSPAATAVAISTSSPTPTSPLPVVPLNHFCMDLVHPFRMQGTRSEAISNSCALRSAYSAMQGHEPRFTNFAGNFCETLDYIFFQPQQLNALAVMPLVDLIHAARDVALPSMVFPSDHLPIATDLTFL